MKPLLDGSWPLLARPGRPKIALGPALARPGRVPNASRRVPETALDAQNQPFVDFSSILARFFVVFVRCFVDFRRKLVLICRFPDASFARAQSPELVPQKLPRRLHFVVPLPQYLVSELPRRSCVDVLPELAETAYKTQTIK